MHPPRPAYLPVDRLHQFVVHEVVYTPAPPSVAVAVPVAPAVVAAAPAAVPAAAAAAAAVAAPAVAIAAAEGLRAQQEALEERDRLGMGG